MGKLNVDVGIAAEDVDHVYPVPETSQVIGWAFDQKLLAVICQRIDQDQADAPQVEGAWDWYVVSELTKIGSSDVHGQEEDIEHVEDESNLVHSFGNDVPSEVNQVDDQITLEDL